MTSTLPWWKAGVVYQIYPRSFLDSTGDGVGDLRGILSKLDYLNDGTERSLGVDAIWLSPIYPSPDADFGYDISDYCAVDPKHGTLDDFRELVDACHERGMRVVMDWVVNHSSDQHPWFQASRSSRDDPKRSWYIWADGRGSRPPNNWGSTFGGPAWTRDAATGQFYLHSFLPEQPDLNWREPAVVEAVLEAMRFWFELGVDGLRLDVFNCYLKDAELRDNPRTWNPAGLVYAYIGQRHVHDRDQPEMHQALDRMREVVDAFPERMMVGETLDEVGQYDKAANYCADPDRELNLAFNFRLLRSRWGARSFGQAIRAWDGALPRGWPTWVMNNHDFKRSFTRHDRGGHGQARARLVALMLMTLRGTPFLYYGEEIGMTEARLRRDQILDPPGRRFWPFFKGRDGCRTPMQWDATAGAGFTTGAPWLPLDPGYLTRNVAAQDDDPDSTLSTYRSLIWLRKAHPALRAGGMTLPPTDHPQVLTWRRDHDQEHIRVVLNTSARAVSFPRPDPEDYRLLWSTHPGEPGAGALQLAPHQGMVLGLR